jgi:predicted MFS family arabinose efflux permease
MSDQAAQQPAGPGLSGGYKAWALFVLVVIYTSNFIDRTIVNILGQSIKVDLKLTDGQLGLLSGLAFAVLYSLMGVPIARLAERFKRTRIITISLALWSAFTAACGLAVNFTQLFALRIGVGIGEAGCSPSAQSLISDYYPPHKRSTALAIYSLGIPLGSLFGALLGGYIAQTFGWRQAFMVVGLPGLALAVIAHLTLKEPARGTYDAVPAGGEKPPGLGKVFARLIGNPSFRHMAFGASLASFAGYGIATFAVPYLLRGPFGLDLATAAGSYGLVGGLAAAAGVFLGGVLTDFAGKHGKASYAVIPGVGFLIAAPLYAFAFMQSDLIKLATFVAAPLVLQYLYLGPTFAVTHNLVEPRMRATATALLFLPINLIGLGAGPPFVGWLSDLIAGRQFAGAGGGFTALCPGGMAPAGSAAALVEQCHTASFEGVKWAIIITAAVIYAWAGIHYLLASRTLKRDMAVVWPD